MLRATLTSASTVVTFFIGAVCDPVQSYKLGPVSLHKGNLSDSLQISHHLKYLFQLFIFLTGKHKAHYVVLFCKGFRIFAVKNIDYLLTVAPVK